MEAYVKPWKRILLLFIIAITILSLLLSACVPVEKANSNSNNGKDKDKDKDHVSDGDRDTGKEKDKGGKADKILICHKTGSAKNPYVQISVANDALKDGHGAHEGDIIPAPEGGCPEKWSATDLPAK